MSDEAPKRPSKVTAFEIDPDVVGGNDSHPFTFGGFPGLWQIGRPVLPAALGLTLEGMRELVAKFDLPLVEVKVAEGKAHDTFEVPANHVPSGDSFGEPVQPQPELLEVNGQLIPGPVPPPEHPPLMPYTAEAMERDTARALAAHGTLTDEEAADLAAEQVEESAGGDAA